MVQGEKEELQAALEEAESALEQEENKVFLSIFSLVFVLLAVFPSSFCERSLSLFLTL
jgi:hypothetical protein